MDDREQKRAVRKAELAERVRQTDRDDFVRESMKLRQGKEYFYWLLSVTGLNSNPFATNALTMSFQCGEFNIGQQVRDHIIQVSPSSYLQMLQEKENERLASLRDDTGSDEDTGDSGGEVVS